VAIADEGRQSDVARVIDRIAGLTLETVGIELQQLVLLRTPAVSKHAIDSIANAMIANAMAAPKAPERPTIN